MLICADGVCIRGLRRVKRAVDAPPLGVKRKHAHCGRRCGRRRVQCSGETYAVAQGMPVRVGRLRTQDCSVVRVSQQPTNSQDWQSVCAAKVTRCNCSSTVSGGDGGRVAACITCQPHSRRSSEGGRSASSVVMDNVSDVTSCWQQEPYICTSAAVRCGGPAAAGSPPPAW